MVEVVEYLPRKYEALSLISHHHQTDRQTHTHTLFLKNVQKVEPCFCHPSRTEFSFQQRMPDDITRRVRPTNKGLKPRPSLNSAWLSGVGGGEGTMAGFSSLPSLTKMGKAQRPHPIPYLLARAEEILCLM
jgi:hypothetical protein